MIPSKGGYLRNEVPGITKNDVEKNIEREILGNLTNYLIKWKDVDVTKYNVEFKFKHSYENP